MEEKVLDIVLERLRHLENKIDTNAAEANNRLRQIEYRMNWAFGLATGVGALLTAVGQKIYLVLFGAG